MTNSSRSSLRLNQSHLSPLAAARRLWRRLVGYTSMGQFTTVFAVVTLFLLAFTGFALSRFLGQSIRDGEIDDAITEVQQHVAAPVTGRLAAQGSLEPMTGAGYDEFDAFVQQDILPTGRSRVRVWRWDGVLLYSSDLSAQIGQQSPASDELEAARQGSAVSRVDDSSDLVGTGGFGAQPVFHVFVPLSLDGTPSVQTMLEVEQFYLPIQDRIQRAEAKTNIGVAGAMGFLFAVLFIIVMRGSRTATRQ